MRIDAGYAGRENKAYSPIKSPAVPGIDMNYSIVIASEFLECCSEKSREYSQVEFSQKVENCTGNPSVVHELVYHTGGERSEANVAGEKEGQLGSRYVQQLTVLKGTWRTEGPQSRHHH